MSGFFKSTGLDINVVNLPVVSGSLVCSMSAREGAKSAVKLLL